mmetsp:Transcript_1515/g.3906  ORF Transcript_1515/g.3906 Transcript_1515/m.3906 type:complete len:262 (-) Transcript_1515:121-906(-)
MGMAAMARWVTASTRAMTTRPSRCRSARPTVTATPATTARRTWALAGALCSAGRASMLLVFLAKSTAMPSTARARTAPAAPPVAQCRAGMKTTTTMTAVAARPRPLVPSQGGANRTRPAALHHQARAARGTNATGTTTASAACTALRRRQATRAFHARAVSAAARRTSTLSTEAAITARGISWTRPRARPCPTIWTRGMCLAWSSRQSVERACCSWGCSTAERPSVASSTPSAHGIPATSCRMSMALAMTQPRCQLWVATE